MVGGAHDGQQNPTWVKDTKAEHGPALPALAVLLNLLELDVIDIQRLVQVVAQQVVPQATEEEVEDGRVGDENTANGEGVAKVHRGHGGQLVDKLAAHPDTLSVLEVDRVDEAVLGGHQTGRSTRVEDEDDEGTHVQQGHCATNSAEASVGGSHGEVVGNEADGTRDMDQRVSAVQDGQPNATEVVDLSTLEEPMGNAPFNPALGTGSGALAEELGLGLEKK